ncbi:hypothetical protein HZC32_00845 [Candidatus Woesearchaeota archaeon]|nr:hypothetical protein [Candidatus Woesearchaeota archaeon]
MVQKAPVQEVYLITEHWNYRSKISRGSDQGTKICIYSPNLKPALYFKTRDSTILDLGCGHGKHLEEIVKTDIFERREIEIKSTLTEQKEYLKSLNDKEEHLFYEPKSKKIKISEKDLKTLYFPGSPNAEIYTLLTKYLQK